MFTSSFSLLGLLVGSFPTLQSPTIPLSKKLVPAGMVILIMTFLDIIDSSFFVFWSSAVATNWIFMNDVPNRVMDSIMGMIKNAIEALKYIIADKLGETCDVMENAALN